MSKKSFARRTVAMIAVLMLSLAPVSLADDGSSPFSFINNIVENIENSIENIVDTLGAALGGDDTAAATSEPPEEGGEEEEGVPDFGTQIDPFG